MPARWADAGFLSMHGPFLVAVHPMAELAAKAAEATAAQGKFWPMHDALYEHQRQLSPALISSISTRLGLDMARFTAELRGREYGERCGVMRRVRSAAA